jgi:hypothetical protein
MPRNLFLSRLALVLLVSNHEEVADAQTPVSCSVALLLSRAVSALARSESSLTRTPECSANKGHDGSDSTSQLVPGGSCMVAKLRAYQTSKRDEPQGG